MSKPFPSDSAHACNYRERQISTTFAIKLVFFF